MKADELKKLIFDHETAAPEKRRDIGSTVITVLATQLRDGSLRLSDSYGEGGRVKAKHDCICHGCNGDIHKGDVIGFKKESNRPYHPDCIPS